MECNKGEALRAKEIAERKYLAKDVVGAKKFALKAQNLYPDLEGINQMLATLDVLVAAKDKTNGESNFYCILGVSPQADDETIRKQYRTLALMLHPDKNKSIGAEGAFKHVSEAWSLLSDKNRKSAYDQRNANTFRNGVHNFFAGSTASRGTVPKNNASKASSSSRKKERKTFWTVCYRCKMQYEYMRMYLNHNLLCPNCGEAFFAVETTPPSNGSKKSTQWDHSQQQQNTHQQGTSKNVPASAFNTTDSSGHYNKFQWTPFSKTAGPASSVEAANVVQQVYQKVKRERQEVQAATKREEALQRKNHTSKRPSGIPLGGQSNAPKRKKGNDPNTYKVKQRMGSGGASTASQAVLVKSNSESGTLNVKHLLRDKARKEIQKKLECSSASVSTSMTPRDVNSAENVKNREKADDSMEIDAEQDQSTLSEQGATENNAPANLSCSENLQDYIDNDRCLLISVPDSDIHNFDSDRIESCFGDNQVWAAYDDSDGMPRRYAIIVKVISQYPFKARIRWLNSSISSGLGSLSCVNSGVLRTCGDYRIGKHKIVNSIDCFSHKVRCSKDSFGAIQIFPRKGQVWALYRNWSSEWDELTEDGVIRKYDLIEVLEDYNEEFVVVTSLVKVAGFKAVFHRHLNPREIRKIPREEMLRFSHQVPSYLLTGQESPNAPKGCRELDPAAMPIELLEVIADVEEIEYKDDGGNKDEEDTNGGTRTISSSSREEITATMEVTEVIVVDS